jgi:MoxR-like ATPase
MFSRTAAQERFSNYEILEIEGKRVWVPLPIEIPQEQFVERQDIIEKALAAWMKLDGLPPLNFRLYGPPGVGKNATVYRLAQILRRELYIINGHEELGPEDIACSATMSSKNTIEYVASPIFAAMHRGGICFFDEIGKAPTSALDPLASVLDDRRTLSSVLAGIRLKAHEDFIFCAALNDDEERGLGLPGFINERTRPAIYVGYPEPEILVKILKSRLPGAAETWFSVFLREYRNITMSARTAITLVSYAYRQASRELRTEPGAEEIAGYLKRAEAEVEKIEGGHRAAGREDGDSRIGKSDDHKTKTQPTGKTPGYVH